MVAELGAHKDESNDFDARGFPAGSGQATNPIIRLLQVSSPESTFLSM